MTNNFFGFVFDSGEDDFAIYKIFETIVTSIKNINANIPILFYYGEVTDNTRDFDLEPFINRNELCSITGKPIVKDWPFFICLHGISIDQKNLIDVSLKKHRCFLGSTNIEIDTKIKSKRVWLDLMDGIKVEGDNVFFAYFDVKEHQFEETFKNSGFTIHYVVPSESDCFIVAANNADCDYCLVQNAIELSYRLNVEVRVAGGLIWDSIEKLSNISYFPKALDDDAEPNKTEDCYMCLYNASQGIERLQKTLIELLLSRDNCRLEEEETMYGLLMSHNHTKMNDYLIQKIPLATNKYSKLVSDLSKFYNIIRYNNYRSDTDYNRTYFYDILCSYSNVKKGKDSLSYEELDSFKKNFASLLGDYALLLFENIRSVSGQLNTFTYEIESDSKASIVFWRDEKENLYNLYLRHLVAKKEVLYYLAINGKEMFKDFEDILPLELDPSSMSFYCRSIIENSSYDYYETVDYSYDSLCKENKDAFKKRLEYFGYVFSTAFDYHGFEENVFKDE